MKEKFSTLLSLNAIDMLSASIVPSNTISDQKGSCNSKTGQCASATKQGSRYNKHCLKPSLHTPQFYRAAQIVTNCHRHTQHKCPSKPIHLLQLPGGTQPEKVLHDMMAQDCFILQQKPFPGQICPAPASAATSPATPPQLLWPDFPSRNL